MDSINPSQFRESNLLFLYNKKKKISTFFKLVQKLALEKYYLNVLVSFQQNKMILQWFCEILRFDPVFGIVSCLRKKKKSLGRRVSFFPDENCCYSCWGFKCTCKCKQRWNQVFIDRRSSSGKSLEDSESGFRFIIRERMTRDNM